MKLLELFVTERIGLTHLKGPIKDSIKSAILDSIYQIYYKESKLDPGVRDLASSQVSAVSVNDEISSWLREQLKTRVALHIEEVLQVRLSPRLQVKIDDTKGAGGLASGLTMILSEKLIEPMVEGIVATVNDLAHDYLESEDQLVSNLFRMYKRVAEDRRIGEEVMSEINSEIYNLVTVSIHEAVHLMQHLPQYEKNLPNLNYTSYLAKDNEEFYNAVRRVSKGEHTEDDYRLYRSSPQEISAFANELALKIVDDYDLDGLYGMEDFNLAAFKKDIPNLVRSYIFKMFDDPSNPKEYQVFKRFHKQVYQEFIKYTEQLEKKLRKKLRSKKNLEQA